MNMFNPDTMKNLMENDEIKKMLNDPNIMGNLKNMMGNGDLFKSMNEACSNDSCDAGSCDDGASADGSCADGACCDTSNSWSNDGDEDPSCDINLDNLDNLENIDIEESTLNINDKVTTQNLKNELYNNKHGVIEDILPNGRYVVTFDNDKSVAIKEENLVNRFYNIENID